jgi:ferric-dicitrate binding protein FerR (iron transport regulator)
VSHVRPDRWADVAAGKASPAQIAAWDAHTEGCQRCRIARERVLGARRAMADVAQAPPPRTGWDLLGARLYWTVSSENRRKQREEAGRARTWWRVALPPFAATLGLGVCTLAVWGVLRRQPLVAPHFDLGVAPVVAIPFTLVDAPRAIAATVTVVEGDAPLGAPIAAGARLDSGAGRLGVQIGARSGLVLEKGTVLTVVRLDERSVELELTQGAALLEVEPRLPGQTFRVRAAGRTVEVRGTAFRVGLESGALDVGVAHGRVVVDESEEVAAGNRLHGDRQRALEAPASSEIVAWTRLAITPEGATSELHVKTAGARPIRVDGHALTTTGSSLRLRTNAGRHLVEWAEGKRWVTLEPGESAEVRSGGGPSTSERPSQVDGQLRAHRDRIAECAARAQRHSPGAHGKLVIEIGVHVGGEVDFVAPLSTPDADPEFEQCVIDVVRTHFSFPVGSRATVQKTIAF